MTDKKSIAPEHYDRLDQRRRWLTNRIEAKEKTGWDTEYDESERDALAAALAVLKSEKPAPDPGEGWRIASGDDWKDERCERMLCGIWGSRGSTSVGKPFNPGLHYRVPVDPEPKHPPIPEGWEQVHDGMLRCGDKYVLPVSRGWIDASTPSTHPMSSAVIIRRIPKFRPFANAAEFKPHRDRWWRYDAIEPASRNRAPVDYDDSGHWEESWDESFETKVFDDGSPFGVEVKE